MFKPQLKQLSMLSCNFSHPFSRVGWLATWMP